MNLLTLEHRVSKLEKLIKNESETGSEIIYQNDEWTVRQINDYESARKYSLNTSWGLGGRDGSETNKNYNGPEYFELVAKSNKIYFYLHNTKKDHKYCILVKRGKPSVIFDDENEDIDPKFMLTYEPTFPSIKGVFVPPKPNANIAKFFKAIEKGNTTFVDKMTKQGVNLEEVGPYDVTPLYLAIHSRQYDVAKMLLDAGADPDGTGGRPVNLYAPILLASDIKRFKGDDKFFNLLKAYGSKLNPR